MRILQTLPEDRVANDIKLQYAIKSLVTEMPRRLYFGCALPADLINA